MYLVVIAQYIEDLSTCMYVYMLDSVTVAACDHIALTLCSSL